MTNQNVKISIEQNIFLNKYFTALEDPRRTSKGHFYYPLNEILFFVISAVVSGYQELTNGEVVAIDGKTICGSGNAGKVQFITFAHYQWF